MTNNLLDELVFITPDLPFDIAPLKVDCTVALSVSGSSRKLQLGAPWFLRQPPQPLLGADWPTFCKSMRSYGIPMFCQVQQFDKVPATHVPIRLAKQPIGRPFIPAEVRTADALEIDCFHPRDQRWQWPLELGKQERLKTFVQAIRDATGGLTPIGISLPVGVSSSNLDMCIHADSDFVTFVGGDDGGTSAQAIVLESLTRTRESFRSAGVDIPILVVAPITNIEHAVKLLALGAAAVCIDGLVKPLIRANRNASASLTGNMLGGINIPFQDRSEAVDVEPLLLQLQKGVDSCLRDHGLATLKSLDRSLLRGISQQVCELARIKPLYDKQ